MKKNVAILIIYLIFGIFIYGLQAQEKMVEDTARTAKIVSNMDSKKEPVTNPAKMLANLLLSLYQAFFSNQDIQNCQFSPSCSQFAKEAYLKYDPVQATLMTSDRLQRCNPFAYQYYPRDHTGHLIDKPEEHQRW